MYVCCAFLQIIRILEKLSPKQAHLFNSVSVSSSVLPANVGSHSDCQLNDFIETAESTEDNSRDIITTAFPFLLQSKIAADC